MSHRPSPFDNTSARQSPFRRQNSASPATVRGVTPASSPAKSHSGLSPVKPPSLSPEKTSPFVRRPSQISHGSDRPSSPFARPSSSLSIPASPSRKTSNTTNNDAQMSSALPPSSRQPTILPAPEDLETPSLRPVSTISLDGARQSSVEPPQDSPFFIPPSPANLRPIAQRTATSSTVSTVKPPVFTTKPKTSAAPRLNAIGGGGAYSHVPQPLLHSMRESFEVLDSSNSGTVNSAAISDMLSQMGLDNTPAALRDFFPPNAPPQLNLGRYLDVLSGPLAELSHSDELRAAFEAFDVDDSGQIDVAMLRDALLHTAQQPGDDGIQLSEREIENVLSEFTGRRAFDSKSLHSAKGKSEVFKYRDFMASINGGSGAPEATAAV